MREIVKLTVHSTFMFETTKKFGPKVVKHLSPWYIRWFYSIFGEKVKMATSSIIPDGATASDSVVCIQIIENSVVYNRD